MRYNIYDIVLTKFSLKEFLIIGQHEKNDDYVLLDNGSNYNWYWHIKYTKYNNIDPTFISLKARYAQISDIINKVDGKYCINCYSIFPNSKEISSYFSCWKCNI